MHPSEKIERILNQSLKCQYAQNTTEIIFSLYDSAAGRVADGLQQVVASLYHTIITDMHADVTEICLLLIAHVFTRGSEERKLVFYTSLRS